MSNTGEARGARPPGRPPGADGEQTKRAILDAALAAFAERGFDGASIREITGEAGVGHNLVRHYFGSKRDLWRAAMAHGLGEASQAIVGVLADGRAGSASQTLRSGLQVLLSASTANPNATRMLINESLRGGDRFDEMFDEVVAPVGDALVRYLAEVDEEVADVDPRVLGLFVFGAVFSPFSFEGMARRLGLGRQAGSGPFGDQLIDMVVAGITVHDD